MKSFLLCLVVAVGACAHLTTQDKSELATYESEQSACLAAHETKPEIDKCRNEVKARWSQHWNGRFDGGF